MAGREWEEAQAAQACRTARSAAQLTFAACISKPFLEKVLQNELKAALLHRALPVLPVLHVRSDQGDMELLRSPHRALCTAARPRGRLAGKLGVNWGDSFCRGPRFGGCLACSDLQTLRTGPHFSFPRCQPPQALSLAAYRRAGLPQRPSALNHPTHACPQPPPATKRQQHAAFGL